MVSTSFETGIGQRWLAHLAALQLAGPTPVAPGLAPGWRAAGALGSEEPEAVWQAAGAAGARGFAERA
jgi:O-succinylbenzoate synthase